MERIYNTLFWRIIRERAFERDGNRCTVSRLLGGDCSPGPLHAHHIVAVDEGGSPFDLDNVGTTCAAHHPVWESLRRLLVRRMMQPEPRCRHYHRTREAREICERRMSRHRNAALAA